MGSLHDQERCPRCRAVARVTSSRRKRDGLYRWRRKTCGACGHAWSTYESTINVEPTIDRFLRKKRRGEPATVPDAPPAPMLSKPAPLPADPPVGHARGRRVSRSSYLG